MEDDDAKEDFHDDLSVFGPEPDDPMGFANADDTSEQHPKQDDDLDIYRDRCGSLLTNFSPTPNQIQSPYGMDHTPCPSEFKKSDFNYSIS